MFPFPGSCAIGRRTLAAAINGAFNLSLQNICNSIKGSTEDLVEEKEEIYHIEEEPVRPPARTNERRTKPEVKARAVTNPPPKPPEKKSINWQWSNSTQGSGDRVFNVWQGER
ncbi:unnamed protein product [Linum trigynum]|uniref:Uncharacterized protein n=1 Tax=Linum trigynum TaxID=586398 RepID=A0AAV2CEA0_9ROSI